MESIERLRSGLDHFYSKTLYRLIGALIVFYAVRILLVSFFYPSIRALISGFNLFHHDGSDGSTENDRLHAIFLSIGQGDSAILQLGSWTALVDTGLYEEVETLERDLAEYGIDHFDAVLISHPHYDHMGSLQTVLMHYPVGQVFFADIPDEFLPDADWPNGIMADYYDVIRIVVIEE